MAENNSSAPLKTAEGSYPALPAPDTHCHDEDTGRDVWSYSAEQMRAYAAQAVAAQAAPAAGAVPDLQSKLLAAANYIDVLGGDSKSYRAALAAIPEPPATEDSSAGDLAEVPASCLTMEQAEAIAFCSTNEPTSLLRHWFRKGYTAAAAQAEVQAEPVIYVSRGQLENHTDPESDGGRYLPARRTPLGLLNYPLYTAPQAQPADALIDPMPKVGPVGLSMLIAEVRKLPTTSATEIDGEESDGTPKVWRNRPFVSLTQLELLLHEFLTLPAPEAQLTDGLTQAARNALADPTTKDGAS